ncbi:hypothetical protein VOLCADRAFT_118018 [Volvox carteri f. nagariensis]|uniref:Uncharacterized protein n=1 Tax=Volvox carteri f. nagariensis TaxID=3068 RepID=D8U0A6_VOLCA|nr:uncharacterized protein VOLCADRAFT_118018 [Volvox carteri f. nagariensis]EFJ46909.1 hypothetical protein VOLCADRAFT_118018 [Volvox carteri f. nagariensis]|eukprot:XP_002952118.1 hypothetical protein VOLCADRAFT_118018 [Volvox carteri f. nagariensis]
MLAWGNIELQQIYIKMATSMNCTSAPYACARASLRRTALVVSATSGKKAPTGKGLKGGQTLEYGNDWYKKTRELARPRTVREEIEYRRQANLIANNGKERKDLYTDNWDGSEYKGSPFNILTLVGALFILTPVAGLVFAFYSYGILWG